MKTTSTQYTSGPWTWIKLTDTIISNHPDYRGSMIAKIATGENAEEEKANAKLIASAPALAEALRVALLKLECMQILAGETKLKWESIDKARAALAQIDGGAS